METTEIRKIQAHRKSRQGCGNCKLRNVKCDEKKPACKRCIIYGVTCSYDRTVSRLRTPMESIMTPTLPPALSYWRHPKDQILTKFQMRTAPTVSIGKRLTIYQNDVTRLAPLHPFLMHAIATLTLMHDRHLLMSDTSNHRLKLTTAESSHWYQAVSLFNNRLSLLPRWHAEERPGSSQIALLSTAAILWTVAFCHIEARSPEEAWPLNSASSDLNWLQMNNGKEQIWKLTQSYPPDPMSRALSSIHNHELLPTLPGAVNAVLNILPPEYIRVFNLDNPDTPPSTGTKDPYYAIGVQVAQIVYMNVPIHVTVLSFISFLSGMSPEVKGLLQAKDPRVLLALVLCYAKLYHVDVWWLSRRLLLEGQAICIYLERFFSHDVDIQTLLQFPKMVFHLQTFS